MFQNQVEEDRVAQLLEEARVECSTQGLLVWDEKIYINGGLADEQDFEVTKARPMPLQPQFDVLFQTYKNRNFDQRRIVWFYEVNPAAAFSFPSPKDVLPRISARFEGDYTWLGFYPSTNMLTPEMGQCFVIAVAFDDIEHANAFREHWDRKTAQEVEDALNEMERA